MPRYSYFKYGTRPYGLVDSAITQAYLFAQVIDYTSVYVEIEAPEKVDKSYVLVRTKTGSAEDPSSGAIVSSGIIRSPFTFLMDGPAIISGVTNLDTIPVSPGIVYYTLFTFDEFGAWSKDASTSLVVPKNKGATRKIVDLLPRMYTSEDRNPLSPVDYDSALSKFLYGFGLTYDELSTSIDQILPENRTTGSVRRLHDSFAMGVGMPSEYTVGVSSTARLFRESGYIYRNKGTLTGIATYVESLTGWQTTVTESTNRFLSLDDGSFEHSTGNWVVDPSQGTLEVADVDELIVTRPTVPYDTATYPFVSHGVGKLTFADTTVRMSLPGSRNRLRCIQVNPLTNYCFNIPLRAVTGTPTATATIEWLDEYGDLISTSSLDPLVTSSEWQRIQDPQVSPEGAAFAALHIDFTGAVDDEVHIDMLCFSEATNLYRDPRSVIIVLQPNRVNLLFDPSFELESTPWTATAGTFETTEEESLAADRSGKATGEAWEFVSNISPIFGYYPFSATAYAKTTDGGSCTLSINWYDQDDNVIRVDSQPFPTLTTDWTRLDFTTISPTGASKAAVSFSGSGTVYVDEAMFERADRPQTFFSGDVSDIYNQDGRWSNLTPDSYSLLYTDVAVKMSRLKQTLPYYLPVGVTARVLLWDSQEPEVQSVIPLGELT